MEWEVTRRPNNQTWPNAAVTQLYKVSLVLMYCSSTFLVRIIFVVLCAALSGVGQGSFGQTFGQSLSHFKQWWDANFLSFFRFEMLYLHVDDKTGQYFEFWDWTFVISYVMWWQYLFSIIDLHFYLIYHYILKITVLPKSCFPLSYNRPILCFVWRININWQSFLQSHGYT